MGMQVSMNEKDTDLLLQEREVGCVKTEVSKYELATNLAIWDSDIDLDMDVGNDF